MTTIPSSPLGEQLLTKTLGVNDKVAHRLHAQMDWLRTCEKSLGLFLSKLICFYISFKPSVPRLLTSKSLC